MYHSTGINRTVSRVVAVAVFATGQQIAAFAEEGLQLRVPQSFSSAPAVSQLEELGTTAHAPQAYDEVEVVRERYPDGKIKIERQVTLDADGNYVNHGPWKLYSPSEVIVAEGQYDMGKRVGSWTRWLGKTDSKVFSEPQFRNFKAPFASQASFSEGVMDGEWLVVDADNKKMMQVSLTAGERNGLMIIFLPNGKTYRQASYDHGVPVGDILEADSKSGELKRVATYIDGRRIVTKTAHFKRNNRSSRAKELKKSEEMFLAATTVEKTPDSFWNVTLAEYESQGKDLHHGPSKMWFENGKPQVEGYYQQDKRAGTFTYWYENGQIAATGEFADDKPNDVWVWWHENGQKAAVGKYRAGALVDDWRWWNNDGKLAQERTYSGTEATASNPKEVLELGRAPKDKDVAARQASGEQSR
jgi:antitoxin component YwqK of YwqJK toxin-antitoxin module